MIGYAAVAIITSREGKMLFIRRRENPSDPWSGDIAFPGGRKKDVDLDFLDTVYREVWEEVGINLRDMDILPITLGIFTPLSYPDLKVYAYVFWIDGRPKVRKGGEVGEVFWIDVENLVRSRCRRYLRALKVYREVDCFRYRDLVIWGMTYRILNSFLSIYYPGV